MHNSKKPCISCQLKAADARIAELEKDIKEHRGVIVAARREAQDVSRMWGEFIEELAGCIGIDIKSPEDWWDHTMEWMRDRIKKALER